MAVIFTSFENSHRYRGKKFSIVRYQPKGYNFDELLFLAPVRGDGKDLRSRDFIKFSKRKGFPPKNEYVEAALAYREAILAGLREQWDEIWYWLTSLSAAEDIVLCCWCPHTASAREQMRHVGEFLCHSAFIARIVLKWRPDLEVMFDNDRSNYMSRLWTGNMRLPRAHNTFCVVEIPE